MPLPEFRFRKNFAFPRDSEHVVHPFIPAENNVFGLFFFTQERSEVRGIAPRIISLQNTCSYRFIISQRIRFVTEF